MPDQFKHAVYRLVDVQSPDGHSKVETQPLYRERAGCIAKNLRVIPFGSGTAVRMDFVQDAGGNWINRPLRTSPISEISEEDMLTIRTKNSIYILEPAELVEPEYPEDTELIELFLSEDGMRFCKGIYHDADKKLHELQCITHLGMVTDSCLIYTVDDNNLDECMCRYFPESGGVEFYNTLYNQQDYSRRLLIHNTGLQPLKIRFESYDAVWTLLPGEQRMITPYCADGADEPETD